MSLEQLSYKFGKGYTMTEELRFTEKHGIAPKELIKVRERKAWQLENCRTSLSDHLREADAARENIETLEREIAEIDASLKILANA